MYVYGAFSMCSTGADKASRCKTSWSGTRRLLMLRSRTRSYSSFSMMTSWPTQTSVATMAPRPQKQQASDLRVRILQSTFGTMRAMNSSEVSPAQLKPMELVTGTTSLYL